jgi:hypothetical protein
MAAHITLEKNSLDVCDANSTELSCARCLTGGGGVVLLLVIGVRLSLPVGVLCWQPAARLAEQLGSACWGELNPTTADDASSSSDVLP